MCAKDIKYVRNRHFDYILSPCVMTTCGLLGMLDNPRDVTILDVENQNDTQLLEIEKHERIVVFIPDEPYLMLSTLKYLVSLMNNSRYMFWVLILSRIPSFWIWNVIKSQVVKSKISHSSIHIAPSDLSCEKLSELLLPERTLCPLIQDVAVFEDIFLGKDEGILNQSKKDGLSKKELQVMSSAFNGDSITSQADLLGVSKKTVYNQRLSGIKKMVGIVPFLFWSFREKAEMQIERINMLNALTPFEREFAHALYCNELFVVLQPVTKGTDELEGFELLIRWYSNGQVLMPANFLPKLHSTYVWIILTAFLIQKTVSYINFYEGKYFFSINVASSTIDNEGLVRMLEKAKKKLLSPDWAAKFVLEINEKNDLYQNEQAIKNLSYLQQLGFCIVLDDCFSSNSVIFPIRKFQFNGYKLDMSVVDALNQDVEALALVKSLSYYCKLTNRYCVAEGVDETEKITILSDAGISYYQGNLISEPITENYLSEFISKFNI